MLRNELQYRQSLSSLSIDSEDRRGKIVIDEIEVVISEWRAKNLY